MARKVIRPQAEREDKVSDLHGPLEMWKHRDAILFLNKLIIDLKLQQDGRTDLSIYEPITSERLNEATRQINSLKQCTERDRIYY